MDHSKRDELLSEFQDGRTDVVFELLTQGFPATFIDSNGVSLVQTCAYYGDVSAIRFLLKQNASLDSLGPNYGLNAAAFHGHWQLCKFLLETGAAVNSSSDASGETALHAALCKTDRLVYDRVLEVLLGYGADPNMATVDGVETGSFMRDCRTKGETALHRAAAFGDSGTIQLLLDAGARVDARDAHGDTPLSWASWYLRPAPILHQLCHGGIRVNPNRKTMRANLVGFPHQPSFGQR